MKSLFKYGCLGCLGCLGLVLVVVGLVVGTAWIRSRSERVDHRVLTGPVPGAIPGDRKSGSPGAPRPSAKVRGKVILDLSDAQFEIGPGAAGEPIRVDGTFDVESYELDGKTDEAEDGTWTYRVGFHRTSSSSWWFNMVQHAFSKNKPKVRIFLRPDAPIALETKIERGGALAELKGLRLSSAAFDVRMGGLEIRVSEPLAEPSERFEVKTEMGGLKLHHLGNASPRVLDVEYRMGGLEMDLRGPWANDADITIHGSMGGCDVRLPTDVRVTGVPGRSLETSQTGELPRPTLRFSMSVSAGEVKFD